VPDKPLGALLVDDRAAAILLAVSRSHFFTLKAAGKIGPQPIRLGRAVRYRRDELERWIAAGCPDAATWKAMQMMEGGRLRVAT
jgi:predicted DNA-binding transcriptional regulator AlpA